MTKNEAHEFSKQLGKLFPGQLTPELAAFATRDFIAFSADAVRDAITSHRRNHEFISIPNLIEGCRAATRDGQAVTENTKNEGTWFDVHRRQNPQLAKRSDAEVALRIKRGEWVRVQQHYPNNLDNWRAKLDQECRRLLGLSGMDEATAASWTATIFEPPDYFRQCLEQLRSDPPMTANVA